MSQCFFVLLLIQLASETLMHLQFPFQIESLYPEEMGPDVMPLEDFLVNGLPLLDQKIEDRIKQASANGNVLRYVCLIDDAR